MNHVVRFGLTMTLALWVAACASKSEINLEQAEGQTLYTAHAIRVEKQRHYTSNYQRGSLVPVNSRVVILDSHSGLIKVRLVDGGQELRIHNVSDYSGTNIDGVFERTFSETEIDLSGYSEADRKSIAAGEVEEGMSKDAVIMALGYPPRHRTSSLEEDEWRYWSTKYDTFVVRFQDGKVVKVQK